jgi:multidrug efflux system outer membrane protein
MLRDVNANIGAARAAFFPTISLTGNLGTASSALSGLFNAGSLAWSLLPSINLPVFEGGPLQGSLDVATVQKDIDVAQYEKAIQTAFREVADGLAARGTYDDEVAAVEGYTEAQQRALDLSETRFRNGVDNYLAVLTALPSRRLSRCASRASPPWSICTVHLAVGGSSTPAIRRLPLKM